MNILLSSDRCARQFRTAALLGLLLLPIVVLAEHPIDVERAAAKREYLDALAKYDRMPKRVTTVEASMAAARSAWALGLPERALAEFEAVSRMPKLTDGQRATVTLSRGIIEFQEKRYQVAALHAEAVLHTPRLNPVVAAHANVLWGDALVELGQLAAAEERYKRAWETAPQEERFEISFKQGLAREKLGKTNEAISDFTNVPLNHERTPEAIRRLALLSIDSGNVAEAGFWLAKARADYPDLFLDSWVDYAMLQVAASRGDLGEVRSIRERAIAKYPPSDPWLALLDSAAEAIEWKRREAP